MKAKKVKIKADQSYKVNVNGDVYEVEAGKNEVPDFVADILGDRVQVVKAKAKSKAKAKK